MIPKTKIKIMIIFQSKININEILRNNTNTNIYYNRYLKQKENKIINSLENSSKKEPQDNISKIKYIKISGKHKEKKPKKGIIIKMEKGMEKEKNLI